MADNADFVVRLEGFKLSPADRAQLAAEIQGVVMRKLGAIDTGGDKFAQIPWKEWYGIRAIKDLSNFKTSVPNLRF